MKNKEIARGGLLAAAAIVILLLGSVSMAFGVCSVIVAGVCTALPLMRRQQLRTAVLCYLAVCVLSVLLVPRKALPVAYIVFGGLYPITKYGIEKTWRRGMEWFVKFLQFNVSAVAGWAMVQAGLFPAYAAVAEKSIGILVLLLLAANAAFVLYDIGLSRLIAALRNKLPPL